jgi:putative oxidoreductase
MTGQDTTTELRPTLIQPIVTGGLSTLGLLAVIYAAATISGAAFPLQAKVFAIAWLVISITCTFLIAPKNFVAGFLLGLFALLGGWRIVGLLGVTIASWALLPAFIAFVLQFFDCLRADRGRGAAAALSATQWQLAFLRIYAGFDMVPHFTEKLFAGPAPRLDDIQAFAGLGLPMPEFFVILGGLCELGVAIGIGLGLLTRLAGFCAALYFMIATVIGGRFLNGFIWASPNGGWEYPVLMMAVFLSFTAIGGGPFSLDAMLTARGLLPRALQVFAGRRT